MLKYNNIIGHYYIRLNTSRKRQRIGCVCIGVLMILLSRIYFRHAYTFSPMNNIILYGTKTMTYQELSCIRRIFRWIPACIFCRKSET